MSNATSKRIPAWVWGLAAVLCVGAVALLATQGRRDEPAASFRYEIADFEQVDSALMGFVETGRLSPELAELGALATTQDGRILVAGANAIVVYGVDGNEQARFVVDGTPGCLARTPDGDILLGMGARVDVLDSEGKPKASWPELGERARITSIVADADDVYVADAGNRVVLRYDREGNVLGRIGEKDPARDIPGFIIPSPYFDVALDEGGVLWAVNPGRHGLESYRPDGSLIAAWYRPSMDIDGFCGCCNPSHIAFRSDGSLVTVEKGLARVKIYSVDQKLMGVVASPHSLKGKDTGAYADELEASVKDLAVDVRGRILVLDSKENAVRIFEEKEPAPDEPK